MNSRAGDWATFVRHCGLLPAFLGRLTSLALKVRSTTVSLVSVEWIEECETTCEFVLVQSKEAAADCASM